MTYRTLALMIALLPLAACAPKDLTMGGALRHNMALQIIDPDPVHAGAPIEGGDGDHAARAMAAYRKGAVKQPVTQSTTSIISNSASTPR